MGGAVSFGSHGNAPPRYVRPKARDPTPLIANIAVDAKRRRRVIPRPSTIVPPRQRTFGAPNNHWYSSPLLMSRAHRARLLKLFRSEDFLEGRKAEAETELLFSPTDKGPVGASP